MKKESAMQPAGKQLKPGRPVAKANPEIMEEVLFWISSGNTLRSYCRQEGKPAYSTIYNWLNKDEDLNARFTRAREMGADWIADSILEMVDEKPVQTGGDNPRIDPAHVQWTKNRAEIRLKLLAKWFPQKWSDKTNVDHSGGVSVTVTTGVPQ